MVIELHFKAIAKLLFDNADVLQTLYNLPMSAASAVALNQCPSNVRYSGPKPVVDLISGGSRPGVWRGSQIRGANERFLFV